MRTSRTVVDKCTGAASRWLALVARILLPAGLFAMSVFGAIPNTAHAQTYNYCHGTQVASIAAGRSVAGALETDVRAYSATGNGSVFGEGPWRTARAKS